MFCFRLLRLTARHFILNSQFGHLHLPLTVWDWYLKSVWLMQLLIICDGKGAIFMIIFYAWRVWLMQLLIICDGKHSIFMIFCFFGNFPWCVMTLVVMSKAKQTLVVVFYNVIIKLWCIFLLQTVCLCSLSGQLLSCQKKLFSVRDWYVHNL